MDELKIHISDLKLREIESQLPKTRTLNLNGGSSRFVYYLGIKRRGKR